MIRKAHKIEQRQNSPERRSEWDVGFRIRKIMGQSSREEITDRKVKT